MTCVLQTISVNMNTKTIPNAWMCMLKCAGPVGGNKVYVNNTSNTTEYSEHA